MRHGVVERVLPVQRGGRVETEQLAGPGAADSGPSPSPPVTPSLSKDGSSR